MDRAAGVGFLFLVKSGSSYIPFSYESLKVMGTLPNRFFVHSRYREDADPTNEMTTFDITIMAEDGPVLVEVEGFSHKRINDITTSVKALVSGSPATRSRHREPAGGELLAGQAASGQSLFDDALSQGISPAEGVEAFARILSTPVSAQVIVSPNDLRAAMAQAK